MGAPKVLYIFLDESGNLDFSSKGTRFWSLTALCTTEPVTGREAFTRLLYDLAVEGNGIECFHATEDRQNVRDRVFKAITELTEDFEVHSVIAEKAKAHPTLYRRWTLKQGKKVSVPDQTEFYKLICGTLLKYLIARPKYADVDQFVVILSSIFDKQKHAQIEGGLKGAIRRQTDKPFNIYFRQNKTDINCQLADYCGWAIAIAWERNERRSLEIIQVKVKSQFAIFDRGTTLFY